MKDKQFPTLLHKSPKYIFRIYCIWALLFPLFVSGQTVLLEREVRQDTVQTSIGPNRKHHFQIMIGIGNFFGQGFEDFPIRYGNSRDFNLGIQYKHKIDSNWSWGGDLCFRNMVFRIDQNSGKKIIPDTISYERERFSIPQFSFQPWFRYNFDGNRGDRIGLYIDAAPGIHFAVSNRRVVVFKQESSDHVVKLVERKLDYMENLFATFQLRIGYQRVALYGQWRFTPLIKSSESKKKWGQSVDFPPFQLGLQFAFF